MIHITKASGDKEIFDKKKIQRTVLKAGASKQFASDVANKVEKKIHEGMTTKKILTATLDLLKDKPEVASRYDLKRAIMSLGPSGFPFEKFFAKVLENYGYKTKVGNFVSGKNVKHEVDIIAEKKSVYMIECKYHNQLGIHTNLKVALYTYARFLDLKNYFDYPWLATNTKCSPDALNYAKSVNMKITTWNYPKSESLQELIERKKLYPITILNSVKGDIKERLSQININLAKSLVDYSLEELKSKTGFSDKVLNQIIKDANQICYC